MKIKQTLHSCSFAICIVLQTQGAEAEQNTITYPDGSPLSTQAKLLECTFNDGSTFVIELFRPTEFGFLHCVFDLPIADMTPCSPDGGWGLSFSIGSTDLSATTDSWVVASDHYGGKFSAHLGPQEFTANATFGEGITVNPRKDSEDITLSLSRETGTGSVLFDSDIPREFSCEVVQRKF